MKHHLTAVRSYYQQEEVRSVGKDVAKRDPLCTVGGNVSQYNYCGKTVWRFLKKLKIELPYNPAISLLGIYPKEMKTLAQKAIRFVVVRGMGWEKWELDKGGQVNLFDLLSLNRRWC